MFLGILDYCFLQKKKSPLNHIDKGDTFYSCKANISFEKEKNLSYT